MFQQNRLLGGRYQLDERIGGGGMGEVWRATDTVLQRVVAVKVMLPTLMSDPAFERRFLFEARAMASIQHPGVVTVHDYRSDADGAFLVMDYVEGDSLAELLRRYGRLQVDETMRLVAQAADALHAAHKRGIVHRDVKPANLLVRPDGGVILTDFGIARGAAVTALTTSGSVLGTPSYLAPEQVLGHPSTPLSDVYSLGVVAYECISGRRPFTGDNPFAVAIQRLHETPAQLDGVPPAAARVVGRALASEPTERWRSAAEMARAARKAASTADVPLEWGAGAPVETGVRFPRLSSDIDLEPDERRRRRRRRIAIGVVIGLVLFAIGVLATAYGARRNIAALIGRGSPPAGVAANFTRCGDAACPTKQMCWAGAVVILGRVDPLRPLDCAQTHVFETFAEGPLAADAVDIRQDELLDKRPEIAAVCSQARMVARSRDPAQMAGWVIEPWPVKVGDATWIFQCISRPETGETTGSHFRTGA